MCSFLISASFSFRFFFTCLCLIILDFCVCFSDKRWWGYKCMKINLLAPCVLYRGQAFRYSPENAFYIYLINKYISLSDICLTVHHWYKEYGQPTRCNNNGLLIIPVSSTCLGKLFCPYSGHKLCITACDIMHSSCNTHSSVPEDGQNNCPKHVELTGIINKPLLLHLVGCPYYLYQWCTVKQISDNEIYLLIKYIKSVLWRLAKCQSYIEEARCLKVKQAFYSGHVC